MSKVVEIILVGCALGGATAADVWASERVLPMRKVASQRVAPKVEEELGAGHQVETYPAMNSIDSQDAGVLAINESSQGPAKRAIDVPADVSDAEDISDAEPVFEKLATPEIPKLENTTPLKSFTRSETWAKSKHTLTQTVTYDTGARSDVSPSQRGTSGQKVLSDGDLSIQRYRRASVD